MLKDATALANKRAWRCLPDEAAECPGAFGGFRPTSPFAALEGRARRPTACCSSLESRIASQAATPAV